MRAFLSQQIKYVPNEALKFLEWWDKLKINIINASKSCWNKYNKRKQRDIITGKGTNSDTVKHFPNPPPMIHFLKDTSGKIITEQTQILDILVEFYEEIYKPADNIYSPPKNMTFGLRRVSPSLIDSMESPITLEDLFQAATAMNPNKAPGIDGITIEFYLTFWSFMGPLVLNWYNHILKLGKLSGLAGIGVLSLIGKQGDPRYVANWRPISLLTVDLKIVTKALTNKLIPAIIEVTTPHQTATPGNSIFTSLSIIRDIIAIKKASAASFCILALDQAKAYDRVNHSFLFHLLEVIGIPRILIDSIKAVYSGYTCVIKNLGQLSRVFDYKRGVRQGDSMSTLLYTLALQPALNALHLALHEEGQKLPSGDKILLTAYADDISVFLNNPESSKIVINTFQEISKYSEALVNTHKSVVLGVNIKQCDKQSFINSAAPMNVSFSSIKILGVEFSSSLKIQPQQWSNLLEKSKNKLAVSFPMLQKMTFRQRAQWSKKRLWPRWSYILKVLQPSKEQLRQLTMLFAESIWLGGRHWLSQEEIAVDVALGGLEALLPQNKIDTLRVSMLAKLCDSSPSSIQCQLAEEVLNLYAGMNLGFGLLYSYPDPSELHSLPDVYAAAYTAWDSLPTCVFPSSKDTILGWPAMCSKFLRQQEAPIKITGSLAKSLKVKTIGDIYNLTPSVTRFSKNLVDGVKEAVDTWELPPWPNDEPRQVMDGIASGKDQDTTLQIFMLVSDSVIQVGKWSNAIISKQLRNNFTSKKTTQVPAKSWKILMSAQAPTSFINQGWKFLHGCTPTPQFYYQIGLKTNKLCINCGSDDISYDHQFRTCAVLSEAINMLNSFIQKLNLLPLDDQSQLYPDPTSDHKLANFLILSFIYSVVLVTRSVANSNSYINKEKFCTIYLAVITKHIKYYASIYPPNDISLRYKWSTFVCNKVIAFFEGEQLFILDKGEYKKHCAFNNKTGRRIT